MASGKSLTLRDIKPHPVRIEDPDALPEQFRCVKRRHGIVRGPIHFGQPTLTAKLQVTP